MATINERIVVYDTGIPTALKDFITIGLRSVTVTVANTSIGATGYRGALLYIINEAGGEVPAFSDNIHWRRVTDRNIISV